MSKPEKKPGVMRLNPRAVIRAARKTTEVWLDDSAEGLPTVPSVVRRRANPGIRSVKKTTDVPLD